MKLVYWTTVLSFCANLTDPFSSSIPIAALSVGEFEEDRMAVLVEFPWNFEEMELHKLTQEILSSAGESIRSQVDRLMEIQPNLPMEDFVGELHHGFRNSLHISHIRESQEFELQEDLADWQKQLVVQNRMLGSALAEIVHTLDALKIEDIPYLKQTCFPQSGTVVSAQTTNSNASRPDAPFTRPSVYPNQTWALPRAQV